MGLFTATVQYSRANESESFRKIPTIKALVVIAESKAHAESKIEQSLKNKVVKNWKFTDLVILNCNEITEPDFTKKYAPGFIL